MEEVIKQLKKELGRLVKNPAVCRDYSRFHKDKKVHLGIVSPVLKRTSLEYFNEIRILGKKEIFGLCDELLQAKIIGGTEIAFDWAFRLRKKYAAEDFKTFESWLKKYVDSWGSCDDLCTHALGHFLYHFPHFVKETERWAKSKNLWLRRAAAVSLIYSVRNRKELTSVFKIADILLEDKEDLVQKGYGWALKEASNNFQKEVFDFVVKRKDEMPRTALRYATEKMPASLRKKAMR